MYEYGIISVFTFIDSQVGNKTIAILFQITLFPLFPTSTKGINHSNMPASHWAWGVCVLISTRPNTAHSSFRAIFILLDSCSVVTKLLIMRQEIKNIVNAVKEIRQYHAMPSY